MMFLPKAYERYLSALRLQLQKSLLRGGISEKKLRGLKCIMLCEAFIPRFAEPVDIIPFTDSLLGAAIIALLKKGKRLRVELTGGGVLLINRRLFTALLLLAAENCPESGKITVCALSTEITVGLYGIRPSRLLKRSVYLLRGKMLTTSDEEKTLISVPAVGARTAAAPALNEWDYLLDHFSPVNVFLLR